ncbi:MAG: cache domain-containing protein, partial [Syntrophaceae bacterium]
MRKLSLSAKIVGIVVVAVVVVGATLTACTWYFLNKIYNEESRGEISRMVGLVQAHVADEAHKLESAAQMTAARKDLAEAIEKGDTAFVQKTGKEILRNAKISLITIADKDGKVVGRGHSEKAGDSVLSQSNVRKALGGEISTGIEEGTVVKFSMRAGAPVKLGDRIVGTITTGTDLTSADHAFVEGVKKEFGTECTIFQGDTRVTTTIMKDGQRAVGTKMDNAKVLDTVLAKGQQFLDINTILGREYETAYWPVKDHAGKIAGMLFIGKDRSILYSMLKEAMLVVLAIVAVVGLAMVAAGVFIARSITRPVNHAVVSLSEAAEQVVSASSQVSSASQALAEGASEQAASIEETSSSLEEMSSMTKQNADNATAADRLMKESKQMVERANGSM